MLDSILILTALEQEERALLQGLKAEKTTLHADLGLELSRIRSPNRSISVVKTGIGSVNAALALLLARERVPVDSVLLLGVGGALRDELALGDLVVSTRVLQHDYFYSFDHGDIRIRPGALILSSKEAQGHVPEIDADPELIRWLKKAESGAESPGRIIEGAILSGNEFVGRPERKRAVSALLPDALLVEMEAAGVAQVAQRLGIPFVVAKTVADRLSPEGSIESDFKACLEAACAHAAAAIHSLL